MTFCNKFSEVFGYSVPKSNDTVDCRQAQPYTKKFLPLYVFKRRNNEIKFLFIGYGHAGATNQVHFMIKQHHEQKMVFGDYSSEAKVAFG